MVRQVQPCVIREGCVMNTNTNIKRKHPKEAPLDPYRLARRARQVLGWRYVSKDKRFVDATGRVIESWEVEPLIVAFLKQEIDNGPIMGPRGNRVAQVGTDVSASTVITCLKALSMGGGDGDGR